MKKLLVVTLLALTTTVAVAQHRDQYHREGHRHSDGRWIAPLVIAGVLTYAITRQPIYVDPLPPVYVERPPVYVQSLPDTYIQPGTCVRYIYKDQYGQTIREENRCN